MIHPSYQFPSHLVIVLEGLLLAAALLLFRLPVVSRGSRALWRGVCRLAAMRGGPVLVAAVLALSLAAATTALLGLPVPSVDDELSYLLAADTFVQGRLTNPPHPHWRHFDTIHVLQRPSYASKYPPAQGAILAAGRLLGGHEVVGLWLSGALLGGAMAWLLLAWFPPPWALLGAMVVIARLGVGSYWGHTYWGGAIAAVGGALLYGGLARLLQGGRARHALVLAAGLLVLANSRPFEGLLVALPAAGALLIWALRRAPVGQWLRVAAAVLAVLGPGALLMLHYNTRVTGDPLQFPYQLHQATYNPQPLFLFQPPRTGLSYGNAAVAGFWGRYAGATTEDWPRRSARQMVERASRTLYTLLGPAAAALLVGLVAFRRPHWTALAAAPCLLLLVGQGLSYSWWPHYAAPATGPLIALAMAGGRRLQTWRWQGRRVGRFPAVAVVVIAVVVAVVQLPALRPDPGDWSRVRLEIEGRLQARGGQHLVLVPRSTGITPRWVWNRADSDGAPVVWAHELGAEEDRRLLEFFGEHTPWRLELGPQGSSPRLAPVARDPASSP